MSLKAIQDYVKSNHPKFYAEVAKLSDGSPATSKIAVVKHIKFETRDPNLARLADADLQEWHAAASKQSAPKPKAAAGKK